VQAYLVMATGDTTLDTACASRPFEWIRYAQWAINAPLFILLIGDTAQAPMFEIIFAATTALLAVASLFAAALSPVCIASWPLFAFGIVCGLLTAYSLLYTFAATAAKGAFAGLYRYASIIAVFLFIGYAIVWGVSEGGKKTTDTQEIIIYTVLDLLTTAVAPFFFLNVRASIIRFGQCFAWLGATKEAAKYEF
jgi:bacteriorhodopsin